MKIVTKVDGKKALRISKKEIVGLMSKFAARYRIGENRAMTITRIYPAGDSIIYDTRDDIGGLHNVRIPKNAEPVELNVGDRIEAILVPGYGRFPIWLLVKKL